MASYIHRVVKLPTYIKLKKQLKANEHLIDHKKSKKCYIIGNGPSLKNVDLPSLNGDTIVVNYFFKYGKNIKFKPTFYMFLDNAFATGEHFQGVTDAIEIYGDSTIFILSEKISKALNNQSRKSNIIFSILTSGKLFNSKTKIDLTKYSPAGFNVVADAIITAIYMGYEEIILLGADFSSFASQKSVHVYEKKEDSKTIALWKELFCYAFVANVHIELRKYSDNNDIKIINETEGSLIDAYERRMH